MVSGAPDFWLRGTYIGKIDIIALVELIETISKIKTIEELQQVSTVNIINAIRAIDKIAEITKIKQIISLGETGTLTYFSKAATADIITPTADYRTRVLGAVIYNPTDIEAYLRWKNTGNFILGVPTIGLVGMNPMTLQHPLGAADEVLELYMSAAGAVKGWVVTEEQYSIGTPHAKTVTEILGLHDTIASEYVEGGAGEWTSPTGHNDPSSHWTDEEMAYDDDLRDWYSYAKGEFPRGTWSGYLELTHAAITVSKVRLYQYYYTSACKPTIVDIDVYNGDWHHVYEGEISLWRDWVEYAFTAIANVTKMRVRYYAPDDLYCATCKPWIVEADFFEVA